MEKKTRDILIIIGIVGVLAAGVYVYLENMDPDWKYVSKNVLEDEGYTNVTIISCDVAEGTNIFGWELTKATGKFTYGTSTIEHDYEIIYRKINDKWYIQSVEVDGE